MSPPAFTAGLNGRLGLPPTAMICLDEDWAKDMVTAVIVSASTVNRRMDQLLERGSFYPHFGHEVPVEFGEALGSEPLHFAQRRRRVTQQRCDVHALAARRERRKVLRAARQHVHRAVMVQPAQVMKGDANLQNTLVEVADVAALRPPEPLQRLVLLEELAAVELRDPFEQLRRRRFVTRHGVILLT